MKAVNVNDVLKILHKYGTFIFVTDSKKYSDMKNEIANLPPVILKQRTGKWKVIEVLHGEWEGTKKYACDKCGEKVGVFKSNYCPNCGTKMEGEEE